MTHSICVYVLTPRFQKFLMIVSSGSEMYTRKGHREGSEPPEMQGENKSVYVDIRIWARASH